MIQLNETLSLAISENQYAEKGTDVQSGVIQFNTAENFTNDIGEIGSVFELEITPKDIEYVTFKKGVTLNVNIGLKHPVAIFNKSVAMEINDFLTNHFAAEAKRKNTGIKSLAITVLATENEGKAPFIRIGLPQ